ncbi:MAG: gliding motility-associated C-terminal domain-containing protein [Bacteroidia bacterium]|nr:gliding motility-associated C-terminal domain-containing protein [Bacteroidia bacterium]
MHAKVTVLRYLVYSGLALVITAIASYSAYATHAMGSDLRYECLSGETYRITLTIYRDCIGSNLTDKQNIVFRSDSCGIAPYILKADRTSLIELSPLCPSQQPSSTCNGGILPGVEEHTYELVTTLPQQCPDWNTSWQLCCRNYAITNSVVTTITRMYIEATLDNLNVSCNNSPYFVNAPVPFLCEGEPFLFNNGVLDDDGDSLVFELTNPLDYVGGIPIPVPYNPGFSVAYPMATNPPGSFNFDPNSGQFAFTPNGLQQGIVALRVKEYRNGVLIGSTMRDIQMVVIFCTNQVPFIQTPTNVSGGQLNGNTFSVCAGNTLSFNIQATDPNAIDTLSLFSTLAAAIPNASFTFSGINPINTTFSWPTTTADTGNYFFTVAVADNGCPIIGKANVGFNIIVNEGEILPPNTTLICPATDSLVPLVASTPNPGGAGTYLWTPATGLSNPNIRNPIVNTSGGNFPINYTVSYTSNIPGTCPIIEPFVIASEGLLELSTDPVVHICAGDAAQLNASFTLSGNPVPFTYSWDPPVALSNTGIPNPIASPANTTLYQVTVSTLNCNYIDSVLVIVDDVPVLNPFTNPTLCEGDSITLIPTGFNIDSANFLWSPVIGLSDPTTRNPIANPTSTTTYTLTVSNGCGVATQNVTVNVAPPLTVTMASTDLTCNGINDGTATVVTYGGAGGNNYVWTPNVATGTSATNLAPGNYSVIVLDAANCTDTGSVTISEPTAILPSVTSITDIFCSGDSTGSISVSASGGTPGYTYSLDGVNFVSVPAFSFLTAGIYTFTVRDDNGCTANISGIAINQPTTPLVAALNGQVNTNCNTNLGSLFVSASGGTPAYTFEIPGFSPPSPSGNVSGLFPGTYLTIVTDSLGCTDTVQAEILEITDPWGQVDSLNPVSCFGGTDGEVWVSATDGTPPYQFSIDNGPYSNNTHFTGLAAGPHFISIADANVCEYSLAFFITEPDSLYGLIGNKIDVECNGDFSGEATIIAKGGTSPYQMALGTGSFGPGNVFSNLAAGSYSVTIRDNNGCEAVIPFDIQEPQPLIAVVAQKNDISCFGLHDGMIVLEASGGVPDYTYSLDGVTFVNDSIFPNLSAGFYTLYVRDKFDCPDSITVQIIEPQPVGVTVTNVDDADCFETPSGSITLAGTGGTQPYLFSVDTARTFVVGPSLNNLPAGPYALIIRDANGCTAETTAEINEPPKLLGEIEVTELRCAGDSNAIATAMITGGVPPYRYDWTTGATTQTITNLPAGNYVVLVSDANDCQISVSTEVLGPPTFVFDSVSWTDITCFGGNDGSAFVEAIGGLPPYIYTWSNGGDNQAVFDLSAGDYTVTVTDTNNCIITDTVTIAQPDPIVIEIVDLEDAFCNLDNGAATVQASGGIPEYRYTWQTTPPQEGPTATNLFGVPFGGPYTVTVTDSNNCVQTLEVAVGSQDPPIADFEHDLGINDTIIFSEKGVRFTNLSQGAVAYHWEFGDGGESDEENPTHIYRREGVYTVMLIAYDINFGCPDTATRTFYLIPPGAIYVPNAFTPNGDGHNDNFFPVGIGVVRMNMDIYDRWGHHLVTLYNMSEYWNGRNRNGNAVQEGVYVWVIDATINDGRRVQRAGTVTLIR